MLRLFFVDASRLSDAKVGFYGVDFFFSGDFRSFELFARVDVAVHFDVEFYLDRKSVV